MPPLSVRLNKGAQGFLPGQIRLYYPSRPQRLLYVVARPGRKKKARGDDGKGKARSHHPIVPRGLAIFRSGASARAGEARRELYYHYYSLLTRIDEQQ